MGKNIIDDSCISTERVADNDKDLVVDVNSELRRVMVLGVLHYCGYNEKLEKEAKEMRAKENHYINLML